MCPKWLQDGWDPYQPKPLGVRMEKDRQSPSWQNTWATNTSLVDSAAEISKPDVFLGNNLVHMVSGATHAQEGLQQHTVGMVTTFFVVKTHQFSSWSAESLPQPDGSQRAVPNPGPRPAAGPQAHTGLRRALPATKPEDSIKWRRAKILMVPKIPEHVLIISTSSQSCSD